MSRASAGTMARTIRQAALALLALAPLSLAPSDPAPKMAGRLKAAAPPAGIDTPPPGVQRNAALIKKRLAADYDRLEALYKHLHSHPELSLQESRTAARLAKELREAGFEVTEKVGGHGVVGVLRNGEGPTVLVRCDMDALPLVEKTGLAHASKVKARDRHGREVGVMHACGHDMNMTCWVGAARVLAVEKDAWRGKLIFVAQPAEEIGQGAKRMLADGLYKRFGKPDYALALHCDSQRPHGTVACREGTALANVDSVDIVVKGKGGHGAYPHTTIDPIVLAARIVLDLQTLVSREVNPLEPAVVTVGSINGGTKHNIIPDEVRLQLTVRSISDRTRKQLLDGIKRIAEGCAKTANAPPPEVKVDLAEYTPALSNDVPLTRKMTALFGQVLGEKNVLARPQVMGGEDFSRFSQGGVPLFIYFLGTAPPERVAEVARPGGKPLPSLHSDQYHPIVEPTIRTGVLTMSSAVMHLLPKGGRHQTKEK